MFLYMLLRQVEIRSKQFEPHFGLAQTWRFIDPQSIWAKYEAGGRQFICDFRESKSMTIKIKRLLILM
ncbi:hypothetical protein [Buttiauxella sp. 3AFRM03]|uniref:hypothetical protein n=1 Tax=Buttiauxella sp. 3AFRM03 TaxID=2479367 RepID=UPI00192E351D|nr:hypothetical protein [Buttiauxella sp. 3AFRM03]